MKKLLLILFALLTAASIHAEYKVLKFTLSDGTEKSVGTEGLLSHLPMVILQ